MDTDLQSVFRVRHEYEFAQCLHVYKYHETACNKKYLYNYYYCVTQNTSYRNCLHSLCNTTTTWRVTAQRVNNNNLSKSTVIDYYYILPIFCIVEYSIFRHNLFNISDSNPLFMGLFKKHTLFCLEL